MSQPRKKKENKTSENPEEVLNVKYNVNIINKLKELNIAADIIPATIFVLYALHENKISLLDSIDDENKARRMNFLYLHMHHKGLLNILNNKAKTYYALSETGKELIEWIKTQSS